MSEEKVKQLAKQLQYYKELYNATKKDLDNEMILLQNSCKHEEFIAEHNGDCHKSGYYYTCKNCNLFLMQRPNAGLIIFK